MIHERGTPSLTYSADNKIPRTIGPVTSVIGAATAFVTLVCWLISEFGGFTIPTEMQGIITTIIVFIAGWCVSPRHALARAKAELYGGEE